MIVLPLPGCDAPDAPYLVTCYFYSNLASIKTSPWIAVADDNNDCNKIPSPCQPPPVAPDYQVTSHDKPLLPSIINTPRH
ncbi:hypothetical protein V496_05656 [Pseudogymnoascus sp. VKM F-4515 (FW-2607)]|nr:hypothetical protein V496_05656 [Pseudogymnoascus sp. VKM F-4515 (FW-2607)]